MASRMPVGAAAGHSDQDFLVFTHSGPNADVQVGNSLYLCGLETVQEYAGKVNVNKPSFCSKIIYISLGISLFSFNVKGGD
jgi:hypothetical protein